MSVVKINVLTVAEDQQAELERRFAARRNEVGSVTGFEGFQLLRPVEGEDRYYVVTQFDTEENYQQWLAHRHNAKAEAGPRPTPISTMATTMAFEIVDLEAIAAAR